MGLGARRQAPSSARATRRRALVVLERFGELVELGCGHAEAASHGAPLRYRPLHHCEDLAGPSRRYPEIGKHRHQSLDRRLWPGFLRHPGLQLPGAFREWVDVKGRGKPPLATIDMQETVVSQMVIDVVDQD